MSRRLRIPVIGIGSGPDCDGQILVAQDMLGLFERFVPGFVKVYRQLGQEVLAAFQEFRDEVESGAFPAVQNSTFMQEEQLQSMKRLLEPEG